MGVYLDCNAATPVDPHVLEAMAPFFLERFGNASSREHAYGWDAADAVETARMQVASLCGVRPHEIVFTGSATESIQLALSGARCARILTTRAEHASVLAAVEQLARLQRAEIGLVGVDRGGAVDATEVETHLRAGPYGLVAVIHASNEVGTINPVEELATLAREHGALLFSDSTQAVGRIAVDFGALRVDLAAFSAHKMYGPKGVGALYIRGGPEAIRLEPLIPGGGQERGLRGGTLNVPAIVGFGEACRLAQERMAEEKPRITALRDRLEAALLAGLDDVYVNGDVTRRLPNTSSICFRGVDARELLRDVHVVAASSRSACATAKSGPSHVLQAMGLSGDDAYASVRLSLGRFNTEEEIDIASRAIIASVRKLRALRGRQA